jgi:hypothetical protein
MLPPDSLWRFLATPAGLFWPLFPHFSSISAQSIRHKTIFQQVTLCKQYWHLHCIILKRFFYSGRMIHGKVKTPPHKEEHA